MIKSCELELMSKNFDKLPKCIKTYEKIAKKYLAQPMLKSNASKLYFLSCLCFMANEDIIGAKKQMQMYGIEDNNFNGGTYQELIANMITQIQAKNSDEFSTVISKHNLT